MSFTLKLFKYYLNFNETSNPFLFNAVYSVYQFIAVSKKKIYMAFRLHNEISIPF